MCESSVYVAHRRATSKESLILRVIPGHSSLKGLYPSDPDAQDQRLICNVGSVRVVIEDLAFDPNYIRPSMNYLGQLGITNTHHVEAILYRGENLQLTNGATFYLSYLKVGTRINIGIPFAVPTDKGMAAVEKSIDEVNKTESTGSIFDKAKALVTGK